MVSFLQLSSALVLAARVYRRITWRRRQFEGHKPSYNPRRIELANDAFDIAKASRNDKSSGRMDHQDKRSVT